ncbi:MAG: DUF167 domain-containing protein [Candidatus Diapherotrites archaeon]
MAQSIIELQATPNAKEFSVQGFDSWNKLLKVKIKAVPEKGKANKELLKELSNLFECKVELIKGTKSRKKTIKVHCPQQKINSKLKKL